MNDLLNDIETLNKVTKKIASEVPYSIAVQGVLHELREVIKQKVKLVSDYETEQESMAFYEKYGY